MNKQHIIILNVVALVFLLNSCASKKPTPQFASSIDSLNYAIEYPAVLDAQTQSLIDKSNEARETHVAFSSYPNKLNEPDWTHVSAVFKHADKAGRSRAFATIADERKNVEIFLTREKPEITKRISGAVKSKFKKDESLCQGEFDATGVIKRSLTEAINRQLDKQSELQNEAYRYIDRNQIPLGKKNIKTLKEQTDAITKASFIVYVELATLQQSVEQMASEARQIRKKLNQALEEEHERMDSPDLSKAEKKDCQTQIETLEKTIAAIEPAVTKADRTTEIADTDIPTIRKEYQKALEALNDAIEQKINQ